MPYFQDNYTHLAYPLAEGALPGLYNAQIGAIHAISSQFTLSDRPAIVTMPTGSGKTAVLMMTPYALKSRRVLVITPGRMVREQIAHDFAGLVTLKKASVLVMAVPAPKVTEVKSRIADADSWNALREFDVIVSTPNCVSPGYQGIPRPPDDLFDLVLIDEAHHSAARTWAELLGALSSSRCVLFTATPFRKDDGEIPGRFIYTYPVARAYSDGIFGRIRYVPPTQSGQDSEDQAIAKTAEAVLKDDRANGLRHCLMVRTDRVTRAVELLDLYKTHTGLTLDLVEGKTSSKKVAEILVKLDSGDLDGVVCVNMLGEGFNFPRLKIAAIHKPHKSLEVTLQFIGRFARTNATDIGEAKFIATQSEIDIEGERLFVDGAIWQEIVQNLSTLKIDEETHTREELDRFTRPEPIDEDLSDLSLYSLHPRSHVKIYDVEDIEMHLDAQIALPPKFDTRYRNVTSDGDTVILILQVAGTPKWSSTDQIFDRVHLLLVIHYLTSSQLLFVNASDAIDGLYDAVVEAIAPDARRISTGEIRRVVRNIKNQKIFNLGLRNLQAANTAESYRIITGSDTQATIKPSDARTYGQGHVYLSGQEGDEKVTIGYSSGSKVWAAAQGRIPALIAWCRLLGEKIRTAGDVVTNSNLDSLAPGEVIATAPDNIVSAQWHDRAFRLDDPVSIQYVGDDGLAHRGLLIDLELRLASRTAHTLHLVAEGDQIAYGIDFSLAESEADGFFAASNGDATRVVVTHGNGDDTLIDFVNRYYISFGMADGGLLTGNELYKPSEGAIPIDPEQLEAVDWTGTDIESELETTAVGGSVHDAIRNRLTATGEDVVFCDHGSGEIADFVSLRQVGERIDVTLWHCKGSAMPTAGARVEDAYEVCGQAQKSVAWRDVARIERRVLSRLPKLEYVRGDEGTLRKMLEAAKNMRQSFTVAVVQPGISKAGLSGAVAEVLGATNDHVLSATFKPLKIIASA